MKPEVWSRVKPILARALELDGPKERLRERAKSLVATDARDVEDKNALMKALRENKVADTARGPVSFDKYGNVVGNIYIRKVEKKGARYVNSVIKTYTNVSQFWTYDPDEFLKQPVYNRETWPGSKNVEP